MMTYTAEQTARYKQRLPLQDAPVPIAASEVWVFKSEEDCRKRKLSKILDKDGNILKNFEEEEWKYKNHLGIG